MVLFMVLFMVVGMPTTSLPQQQLLPQSDGL